VHADVGDELVEALEPADVADLGDERRADGRADAGDGAQPAHEPSSEARCASASLGLLADEQERRDGEQAT